MKSLVRPLCRFAISAPWKWWKVRFWSNNHCSLLWLCCWVRCWMLQDMDNMETSCVFYVKVGTFSHLEQSKTPLLTVNKSGIVRLTVQHDLIVSISFMYYPRDYLRQTLAEILFLEQCSIYSWQSCDIGNCTTQLITANKQIPTDQHVAHLVAVGNTCNLQLYTAGFTLSTTSMLAANYCILTWSKLYNPLDFLLLFVIIFLSYSTLAYHGYTTTQARSKLIQIQLIGRPFIKYVTYWHTARTQTPVSPPQCSQCSHKKDDAECTLQNHLLDWKKPDQEAACSWMWVYPYSE